jgi:flagellar protein FlaG
MDGIYVQGGKPMDMSVASVGSGLNFVTPPEFSHNRESAHRQVQAAAPRVLKDAAAELERVSLAFNKKLQFVVDHRSNEVTVKVIDSKTDKVIKELPPEELQRMHSRIKETIGFLFDELV